MSKKRFLALGFITFFCLFILEMIGTRPTVFYGFSFLLGLLGALILIGLAKGFLNKLVARAEDYYQQDKEGGRHV